MADFQVSFNTFGEYMVDMEELEDALLRGGLAEVISIEVIMPGDDSVEVYMRTDNLYIIGFNTNVGQYAYNGFGGDLNGAQELNCNGSHGALQTFNRNFNWTLLPQIPAILKNYAGGGENGLLASLSFLVVGISEALRYTEIRERIVQVINNENSYDPTDHHAEITSWQHNSLNNARAVRLLHPDVRGAGNKFGGYG